VERKVAGGGFFLAGSSRRTGPHRLHGIGFVTVIGRIEFKAQPIN
jgi:hypothetical protein